MVQQHVLVPAVLSLAKHHRRVAQRLSRAALTDLRLQHVPKRLRVRRFKHHVHVAAVVVSFGYLKAANQSRVMREAFALRSDARQIQVR
jgi:hypothetical protein